jgi:arylsulfatase
MNATPSITGNILFVQVDQWNARCLGAMGHPNVRTPNLDRLAAEGTLFANAFCQNPVCLPSRVSMMSGQYLSTNRQFGFTGFCDRRMPWLARHLHDHGYATGAFGKYHTLSCTPELFGFERATPTMGEDEDLAQPAGDHYRAYCKRHGIRWPTDQMHCHDPWGSQMPVRPSSDEPGETYTVRGTCKSDVPVEHSLETWTTDRCIDFLHERARTYDGRPFMAWLSYDRPHWPFTLPEPWFSRVDPDSIVRHPSYTNEASDLPAYLVDHFSHTEVQDDRLNRVMATHHTLLEWLDSEIGRVMQALEEMGMDRSTTIVFTSDHGDEAGYRGLFGKGYGCHTREVMAVPLIIRPAPDLAAASGARVEENVELVDLFPTLCGLHGVPRADGLEGRDLSAVLRGEEADGDRAVFCERLNARAVIWRRWILTECTDDVGSVLVNLEDDPWGLRDRYNDPDAAEVRIELKRRLFALLMQRAHGPYAESDVRYCEDKLHGRHGLLGLCSGAIDSVTSFRACGGVKRGNRLLLVPYYDTTLRLYDRDAGCYHSADNALPDNPALAEELLTAGIHECMQLASAISLITDTRPTVRACGT